jgi:hypothetical protein
LENVVWQRGEKGMRRHHHNTCDDGRRIEEGLCIELKGRIAP